jgi:hypothetical protein
MSTNTLGGLVIAAQPARRAGLQLGIAAKLSGILSFRLAWSIVPPSLGAVDQRPGRLYSFVAHGL